jgi:hypothetical protein|nr:MAG TPA: hypothetical protein [Bacteriophage sp.]
MISNDFIQSLLKRYSIYLFGGKCTIVVMSHLGGIALSCKQIDDGIEYTADYVFEYDGKETADLVGIDVKIVDTVNGVESYSIQSKNACYTYSTLQFIAQMITDNDLDSVHSADVIVGNE